MASPSATSHTPEARNGGTRLSWRIVGLICLVVVLVAATVIYERPMSVLDAVARVRLRVAGFDSRTTQVGSYRVHYFVGGEGKPLLLIHGLGARSEDWSPEMPAYARHGFRVYAIDLLGCGRTSRPDIDYSIQQQADLVRGFLQAVHVEKTDIAGWSMGGWVTLLYALEHPEHIDRVVVMDSAGLTFHLDFGPGVFEPQNRQELAQLMNLLTPHPKALPGFVARGILRRMKGNARVIHRTVQTMLTGRDLLDGHLQNIHVPVLIVWGAKDALIPPSSGEQMHRDMPQSVLELYRGCGHIGPATCANRIVPYVLDFLRSNPAMAGGTYHY